LYFSKVLLFKKLEGSTGDSVGAILMRRRGCAIIVAEDNTALAFVLLAGIVRLTVEFLNNLGAICRLFTAEPRAGAFNSA
jgi:hypothetical protein